MLWAAPVAAQDADPFGAPVAAIPVEAQLQPLLVELAINGERVDGLADIRIEGDEVWLRVEDARRAGLGDAAAVEGYIPLSRQGVRFAYDAGAARLEIVRRRRGDGPNSVDLSPEPMLEGDYTPLTALIVEHDTVLQADRFGTRAGGYVAGRLVRGGLSGGSSLQFQTDAGEDRKPLVRLDTAITWRDPAHLRSATLGDFVSRTPAADRAVRMAGLRFGTDFAIRPDLITYPLPSIAGSVAVPTGIDVLINDRRVADAEVEAGDFTVRNVPVQFGRNRVGVIVRDTLGRERIEDVPLYASRLRLAPGLSATQANLGFVRRNYAVRSSDYGPFAFDFSHRRGFSEALTLEAAIAGSDGVIVGGGGATLALGGLGELSADLRLSHDRREAAGSAIGHAVTLGFESIGYPISATFDARIVSRAFRDVAAASGDPPPSNRLAAGLAFDLEELGRLRLDAVREVREIGPQWGRIRTTFLGGSYIRRIGRRANLYVDVRHDMQAANTTLFAGLSLTLGDGRTLAQASVARSAGYTAVQGSVIRPDAEIGDWGWRAEAATGEITRAAAAVSRRWAWMRAEVQAERVEGDSAARATLQGAFVFADGRPYAVHRVGGGVALVRTGNTDGIAIERENRIAGVSGRGGRALISDIPAWTPVQIAVQPDSLPDQTVLARARSVVRVPEGAAALVDLPVLRVRPLYARILGPEGMPLSPGTRLLNRHGAVRIVGFDGRAEIDGEADAGGLGIVGYCRVPPSPALAEALSRPTYTDIGDLRCRGETTAARP